LLARGVAGLVATTRKPQNLADLASRGVDVRAADFDDPSSLDIAFRGVDRLLLISTDALDRAGHRFEQHRAALDAAVRAGVKHVLYTSVVRADDEGSPLLLGYDHRLTEQALRERFEGFTILRNNWYAENLEGDLRHGLAAGSIAMASGEGRVGWVLRDDCARAAATALADGFEGRRVLDVTGPQALSLAEVATALSEVSGKAIAAAAVPPEVRKGILVAVGLPEGVAEILVNAETSMAQGWLATAPGDVESLTGKAPRPLTDYLRTLVGAG
jgi:NAD(P)H dehydrogenase (quinone)